MFSRHATLPIDLDIKKSTPKQEVLCYANMDEPDLLQLAKERVERLEEAKTRTSCLGVAARSYIAATLAVSQERKSFTTNHTSILKIVRFNAQIVAQFNA